MLLGALSASSIGTQYSKKWQTDADFSTWAKSNVVNIGGDQGLKLGSNPSGVGTATYHFQPGIEAKWTGSSSKTDNAVLQPGEAVWAAISNLASVSEIRASKGEIIKEWPVGNDASRTAVGVAGDAWIGNRSLYDPSGPGLKYSFSHVIPAENKVITRKIANDSLARYTEITVVEPSSANPEGVDYVWIGYFGDTGNLLQKFKQSDFDDLVTYPATLEVVNGVDHYNNGVAIPPVATYAIQEPWTGTGVSYSVNDSKIYYVERATQGRIWYLDIGSGAHGLVDAVSDAGGLTTDYHKNVWGSGKRGVVSRINAVDRSIQYFDLSTLGLNFPDPWGYGGNTVTNSGASVIRDSVNGQDVLVLNFLNTQNVDYSRKVCYTTISNNGGVVASLDGFTCRDSSHTINGNCGARVLGHDRNNNVWSILAPTDLLYPCRDILRFNKGSGPANDFSTSELYLSTSNPAGQTYTFADALGNEIGNSSDLIDIVFSTNPIDATNPGVTDVTQLPISHDLYIKVTFTGDPADPPILRWLQVDYEKSFEFLEPEIFRSTYRTSTDRSNNVNKFATFEKGETVYVRLAVGEPFKEGRMNVKVADRLEGVDGNPSNCKMSGDSGTKDLAEGTDYTWDAGSKTITFTLALLKKGVTYFDYEYKVND